jgi:hypothetical protein
VLYSHPAAPVIRLVLSIEDRWGSAWVLETFVNAADMDDHQQLSALSQQDHVDATFYDETLSHRLTKRVGDVDLSGLSDTLREAAELCGNIPRERYDFASAVMDVREYITLHGG